MPRKGLVNSSALLFYLKGSLEHPGLVGGGTLNVPMISLMGTWVLNRDKPGAV